MPKARALTGQLPLMQVSRQSPQDGHQKKRDQPIFRWNPLDFGDGRSHSVLLTSESNLFAPGQSKQELSPPVRKKPYAQIKFFAAQPPGQKGAKNIPVPSDGPEGPDCKRRRITKSFDKIKLKSTKSKSSSSDMHADAWSIILAHTRPAFLMQMRTVSRFFFHITNSDTIWREARENHFGEDMPPCPNGLNERQYANLLDGRGCQNGRCERRETRKVRWIFRLRLCDDCLSKKLELYQYDATTPNPQSYYASLFSTITEQEQYGTSLIDLLPTSNAWSGKPNGPRGVSNAEKWDSRSNRGAPLLFLKSDYVALEAEFKMLVENKIYPEEMLEWTKAKYEQAIQAAVAAYELEDWVLTRQSPSHPDISLRTQRAMFFQQKAIQLDPPIHRELLECFAAYQTSLASPNPPSQRAWDTLVPKLLPYRTQAERAEDFQQSRYDRFLRSSPLPDTALFDLLHEHRRMKVKDANRWTPEQQFVLNIGEVEFEKLVDRVADDDLLLLCLYNTYQAYQQSSNKPQGLNFDGKVGTYRLSLHDAKMIVEEVVEKRIKKSTLRSVKVCESLRCVGCTRFSSGKRYSFQSAFEHMLEKHAKLVGKDLHFYTFLKIFRLPPDCLSKDYKFPWYLVEWTRSLPLLPRHVEITADTRWIPDANVPYVQLQKIIYDHAFEGRKAVLSGENDCADFISNFVHAIHTLSTTRLGPDCTVKIAIRYATDLLLRSSPDPESPRKPTLDDFFSCIKPTQKLSNSLTFKFRCGACNRRPDVNSHLRCVKHVVDVQVLRKHWDDKHAREGIDWTDNFADLPDDKMLMEVMVTADNKLKQDQEASIEREIFGLKKSAKKIKDQKVGALMRKEMALSAFTRLFEKVQNDERSVDLA